MKSYEKVYLGVAAFLVLAGIAATCIGCGYCQVAAHQSEARCKVEAVASKCGEPAVSKIVLSILPQVVGDLISGDFSALLTQLITTLTGQGVQDAIGAVTCAVAQADSALPVGAAINPNFVLIKTHAQLWAAAHK